MNPPPTDLLLLLGTLVVGDEPYGKFRGSNAAPIFAKAGWEITTYCPATGWELWAADQVRQFLADEPDAIARLLTAMAEPTEFLDKTNRVTRDERNQQINRWNGFLAPHGLRIVATASGSSIQRTAPGYLPADSNDDMRTAVPEEVLPLVKRLHDEHGDRSIFLMLQLGASGTTAQMIQEMKLALKSNGFVGLCATDAKFTDILWRNIQAFMHGCCGGLAIFDRIESDQYNANVALEAGYMIALGKPVAFLKERTVKGLQSDLAGHIWYPFDVHVRESIHQAVHSWLRADRLV